MISIPNRTCNLNNILENLRWLWTPSTEFFNTLPRVASYPAHQNLLINKGFTMPLFKYNYKIKSVLRRSYYCYDKIIYGETKIITMCSPVIGQLLDTMIVLSTKRVVIMTSWRVLETVLSNRIQQKITNSTFQLI